MIPREITKENVLQALADIRSGHVPVERESTKFDLVHDGRTYPPKYVLTIASKYATGSELMPSLFSGGKESNSFLTELGFEIRAKSEWTERECYFAVWGYDQLNQDRNVVKTSLYREIAELTGRSIKSVEWKIQNVSHFDPRPRTEKPIAEAPNAQKLIGDVFRWYWDDKDAARTLFKSYVQESNFNLVSGTELSTTTDEHHHKNFIIEEGAEGFTTSKTRKRSAKLVTEGRKHFRSIEPDGKFRCHACGFVKPESIDREIVQLHHTEMISEVDKDGKQASLMKALESLIPLCPTCHQIAHSSKPPLSLVMIKTLLNA